MMKVEILLLAVEYEVKSNALRGFPSVCLSVTQ